MLYSFKANIFCTKFGNKFYRTAHITICANNIEHAYKEAENSLNEYVRRLNITHENNYAFDNLILEGN